MLVNHVAVDNRQTMTRQKNVLLLALGCSRHREIETTAEILSRLQTIEEVENEEQGFCSRHRPPKGIVMAKITELRETYKSASDEEKFKIEKIAAFFLGSLKINIQDVLGFPQAVQDALI